jgi:RNA polymerase sigma-70 factor, ECF subfamily
MVYSLCLRMISDVHESELITQDVFVKAWQKLGSYQRRGPFGGWLRRITINTIIEERRRQARQRKVMDSNINTTATEAEASALRPSAINLSARASRPVQENTELIMELEQAITKLPAGAKTAFVLHDVEGYRHREIAVMTGVAIGTVKAQLHRARQLLRQSLKSTGEGVLS